jgi:hypothetical protein
MNLQVGTGTTPTNVLHIGTHPIGALTGQTINFDIPTTMSTALAPTSGGTGDTSTPTSAQIYIAQSGTDVAPRTISGDLTVATNGAVTISTVAGSTAQSTYAAGAAAGTGPTVTCTGSHGCGSFSGEVTLTTGTGTPTLPATLLTITLPITRTNIPNCIVTLQQAAGQNTGLTWTETTSTIVLTLSGTALTASTAFPVRYICGGN